MSKFVTLHGFSGGGVNLNFKVVGGTTQPTNPIENTIWINTSTSITSWAFVSTTPIGTSTAGAIYIVYESSFNNRTADFDAIGTNAIWINPIAVYQYINNAWVQKTAKIYKNSNWVDCTNELFLYDQGKEFEGITGGWDISEHGAYGGGAVKAENHIAIGVTPGDHGGGAAVTHNPILLTGKTQLIIDCNIASDDIRIGITADNINVYKGGSDLNFISYLTATKTSGINRFILPIDGNYIMSGYIAAQAWSTTCHIYSIKLV